MSAWDWWAWVPKKPKPPKDDTQAILDAITVAKIAITNGIAQTGVKIMAAIDDLRQTLADTTIAVNSIADSVTGLAVEVNDLIARLAVAGVPQDVLDSATAVKAKVNAIQTALAAIPAEPA